jgi:hypothetical protein
MTKNCIFTKKIVKALKNMGLGPGSGILYRIPGTGVNGTGSLIPNPVPQHWFQPFPLAARKVFSLPFRVLLFFAIFYFLTLSVLTLLKTFLYFVFFNWIISVDIYVCFNKTSID